MSWITRFGRVGKCSGWINEYVSYMIVGGALGAVSWIIQVVIKIIAEKWISRPDLKEGISIMLTFFIIGAVGFVVQKRHVFFANGRLEKFYISNAIIIFVVAVVSSLIAHVLDRLGLVSLCVLAYPVSALGLSPVSFYINRKWVYQGDRKNG